MFPVLASEAPRAPEHASRVQSPGSWAGRIARGMGSIYKRSVELSNTALRADLGNILKGLTGSLEEFGAHIRSDARAVWMWRPPGEDGPRTALPGLTRGEALDAARRAIAAIHYEDGQDAHESRIAPGLLVLSETGVRLAGQVNHWKERLAEVLKKMEGRQEIGVIDQRTGERGKRPLREVALEAFYFRRLHYFQAVRRIVVLQESEARVGTPEYLSYSWASCRAVRRASRELLIEELTRRLSAGKGAPRLIQRDLAMLKRLPAGEPLAVVREAPATVKANVAWPGRSGEPATRRVCSAVAPLVMLGTALPERFRPLPRRPAEPSVRQSRRDTELEPQALLCTMPAFRYLRRHRREKRAGR